MGMAASQARFLGLTARKSNVEYQGQQVNQQRTALANESANLYNQMMSLSVPTPPSTSDFYKPTYVVQDSAPSDAKSDYKIESVTRLYDGTNRYNVTFVTEVASRRTTNETLSLSGVKKSGTTYTIAFINNNNNFTLYYNSNDESPLKASKDSDEAKSFSPEKNTIYKMSDDVNPQYVNGYTEYKNEYNPKDDVYFYLDLTGKYHFLSKEQLDKLTQTADDPDQGAVGQVFNIATTYEFTKPETASAIATIEKSSTGRYSSINVFDKDVNPNTPSILIGEKSINVVQEFNQTEYDDALNDYQYQKALYEKSISDINAKTEIIQKQDQQLELRLDQLDTEQNAIKTELDAVKGIIKDNVESTFKTFNA